MIGRNLSELSSQDPWSVPWHRGCGAFYFGPCGFSGVSRGLFFALTRPFGLARPADGQPPAGPLSDAQIEAIRGWIQAGAVWAVDANGCFSRPGPRVVEGVGILSRILATATTPGAQEPIPGARAIPRPTVRSAR